MLVVAAAVRVPSLLVLRVDTGNFEGVDNEFRREVIQDRLLVDDEAVQ